MKRLVVTLTIEMEVPDNWTLRKTSEGFDVIEIAPGQYMDLSFEPLLTQDLEGTWTDSASEDFVNDLLDMVTSEQVAYEMDTVQ
jgi:hypothetical protein